MASKNWLINDVPEETRKKLKKFAKENRLTLAGALMKLTEKITL